MPEPESTLWGVHAGKTGDADSLFLKGGCVGLGWPKVGDLSKLSPDREAFKRRVAEAYPQFKAGAIPTSAGQLFRFVYELKVDDVVLYRSKRERQIHFGRVTGPYRYDQSKEDSYPNIRPVTWIRAVARTHFTQGALYEIGAAMSFFQVKTYADEFRAAIEGKARVPDADEDSSAAEVTEDIEQSTRDFVLKRLAQELKGHPLAAFVAHLLGAMGYRCRVSPEGPDGGIDIIAHKDELGFEPPIVKVQVKSTEDVVREPVVKALCGNVSATESGLLVTLGTYTKDARNVERNKSNLRLIDGQELVELILQHYEQFDSRYKGLLPLKRVYVPAPLDEGEE